MNFLKEHDMENYEGDAVTFTIQKKNIMWIGMAVF